MYILRYVLSILRRGKLDVSKCNGDATIPRRLNNNQKTANYFSQNDLNCVISARLIEQMSSENMVNL